MPISSECIEQFKAQRYIAEYLHGTLHYSDYEKNGGHNNAIENADFIRVH